MTITVSATDSARLATTPATAALAVWRWWRARSLASNTSGRRRVSGRASSACTPTGTKATPPASSAATEAYAASGRPSIAGISANSPAAISIATPGSQRERAPPRLDSPFSACAGGKACAARAGHQAPAIAAAMPSAPYTAAASHDHCSCGATPVK